MDPTFQYAGKVRIPPKQFQLRSRIEDATKNNVNIRYHEHWTEDVPDFTHYTPGMTKTEIVVQEVDILNGYSAPVSKMTNIPINDMLPMNTRTDGRDYRQSQPYQAGGPDLAHNAYFDRYDPVSDPRNAVRELRSAVYEDKGTARGINESTYILRRNYEHRWVDETLIDNDLMDTYLRYEIATTGKKVSAPADAPNRNGKDDTKEEDEEEKDYI